MPLTFFKEDFGNLENSLISNQRRGIHTSRTLMIQGLLSALSSNPEGATYEIYRRSIVDDNCTGRSTEKARRKTAGFLEQLYILDERYWLFRLLRKLWRLDATAGPQLALLTALSRDRLLRASCEVIVGHDPGDRFDRHALEAVINSETETPSVRATAVRNLRSSWTQAGHLVGYQVKHRQALSPRPVAIALALHLGQTAGLGGRQLLESGWLHALDIGGTRSLPALNQARENGLIDLFLVDNVRTVSTRPMLRLIEEPDAA